MYGISNSQQQGGGGGGAASYKAIKSTLTPSDWQEATNQPYFVGDDVMTWEVNTNTGMPTKSQSTSIGLVAGNSYTITVVADNVTYTSTGETVGGASGAVMVVFELTNAVIYVYDNWDIATMSPAAEGSMCDVEARATSFVITNFEGSGFGTTIQATISDSAIKINSAVTMYTNTSDKIAVGEKTNGNVTLIAPSIPTTDIPYSLEIVGTDTEGLFELVNGYIPEIPDTPSGVPQWHTIYEDTTGTGVTSATLKEPLKAGEIYRITLSGTISYIFVPKLDARSSLAHFSIIEESTSTDSLYHSCFEFGYQNNDILVGNAVQYSLKETGVSQFLVSRGESVGLLISKVEVYR